MPILTRTISCHYEDDAGEHKIPVSIYRDGLGHNDWVIETDLSDVPATERESVEQQAIDGWMDADDKAHGVKRSTSGTKWTEDDYAAAGKGRLVLRIDQTDLDKLDAIAKSSKRSRSAVVSAWIREWGAATR